MRGDVVSIQSCAPLPLDEGFDLRARRLGLLGVEFERRDAAGRALLRVVIQIPCQATGPVFGSFTNST